MEKELKLNEFFRITNSKFVGAGTMGVVRVFDDDNLIKLYREKYLSENLLLSKLIIEPEACDIDEINSIHLKRLRELSEKSKSIKLSKPLNGIVKWSGCVIGAFLHPYLDYISLLDQMPNMNMKEKRFMLENLRAKMLELNEHEIYPWDSLEYNILVNPTSHDAQFIDLDDSRACLSAYVDNPKEVCDKSFDRLAKLVLK